MVAESAVAPRIPTGLPLSDAQLTALANLDEQALRDVLAWVALYGVEMLPFVLALPPEVDDDDDTAQLALGITLGLIVTMRRQQRAATLVWNAPTMQYTTPRGTAIAPRAVRDALDVALERAGQDTRLAGQRLIRREIALAEWQRIMARQITMAEIAASAQARGGLAQLTATDFGRSAARITDQLRFLSRFAAGIADGTVPLDGRIIARATLYIEHNRVTFYEVKATMLAERGFDEESSVLRPAEHCDGCVTQANRGFVALGELIPIGSRECMSRCKCGMRYRNSVTGEEVDA